MKVTSKNGKEVSITRFNDWALVFCTPLIVVNILVYVLIEVIYPLYAKLLSLPCKMILKLLSDRRLVNIPTIALTNFIFLAALHLLTIYQPNNQIAIIFCAVVSGVTTITCLILFSFLDSDSTRMELIFGFSEIQSHSTTDRLYPPLFPKGLETHYWSKGIFYGKLLVTVFVIYNFIFLILAPSFEILFWIIFHAIIGVHFGIDKENIEHISSHSPKGRIVRIKGQDFFTSLCCIAEWVRVKIVWPMFGWFPNMYYLTHTHHHHIENNEPADFQSLQRYDKTSFLDFLKSICWLPLTQALFPLDTLRYFYALGRYKLFRKVILSMLQGYFVLTIVVLVSPVVGCLIIITVIGSGFSTHKFIFNWHGYHDSSRPQSVESSNNSIHHYAHHKKPSIHLRLNEDLETVYQQNKDKHKNELIVYKSEQLFYLAQRHWLLIQALLWQNKVEFIKNLLDYENASKEQLYNLVKGCHLIERHPQVEKFDKKASQFLGSLLENILSKQLSQKHRTLIYGY